MYMTFSILEFKVLQATRALEMVIRNMQLQLYECILCRMVSLSNLDARVQDSVFAGLILLFFGGFHQDEFGHCRI